MEESKDAGRDAVRTAANQLLFGRAAAALQHLVQNLRSIASEHPVHCMHDSLSPEQPAGSLSRVEARSRNFDWPI